MTSLPSLWTLLARVSKTNHLVTLQYALDGTVVLLATQVAIVTTLALLKRLLGIHICMDDWEDLTTRLHISTLRQHTIAVQIALTSHAAIHSLISGGVAMPLLANA